MKKTVIAISLIGSLLIILSSFQLSPGNAMLDFLRTGTVPGTNIVVPPTLMVMMIALAAGYALARLFRPSTKADSSR